MNAVAPFLMVGGPLHGSWAAVPDKPFRRWRFPLVPPFIARAVTPGDTTNLSIDVEDYMLTDVAGNRVLLWIHR